MEVTKTNAEWREIYFKLQRLNRLKSLKLQYAINKNSEKIESHLTSLEKLIKPTDKFIEYDQKRVAIVEKYAEKDEHGQPIIQKNPNEGDTYKVDPEVVKPEVEELDKEYKEVLEERQEQMKQYLEILNDEHTIEVHMVDMSNVPEDVDGNEFKAIKFMLNE